jgi:hypothetical protein
LQQLLVAEVVELETLVVKLELALVADQAAVAAVAVMELLLHPADLAQVDKVVLVVMAL